MPQASKPGQHSLDHCSHIDAKTKDETKVPFEQKTLHERKPIVHMKLSLAARAFPVVRACSSDHRGITHHCRQRLRLLQQLVEVHPVVQLTSRRQVKLLFRLRVLP